MGDDSALGNDLDSNCWCPGEGVPLPLPRGSTKSLLPLESACDASKLCPEASSARLHVVRSRGRRVPQEPPRGLGALLGVLQRAESAERDGEAVADVDEVPLQAPGALKRGPLGPCLLRLQRTAFLDLFQYSMFMHVQYLSDLLKPTASSH